MTIMDKPTLNRKITKTSFVRVTAGQGQLVNEWVLDLECGHRRVDYTYTTTDGYPYDDVYCSKCHTLNTKKEVD